MFTLDETPLSPYVPALLLRWMSETPDVRARALEGTLAFVDISGFTRLTEMLAEHGKAGAEELTGYLDTSFAALLDVAYANGAELVKWGGDAVLLWYSGDAHAARAAASAWHMQTTMRKVGRLRTSCGRASLRMSVGVHSGEFHFFSVGSQHRELIVTGPSATRTAHLESIAEAGEIVLSREAAAYLEPEAVGACKADGFLLASPPITPQFKQPGTAYGTEQIAACLPAKILDFLRAAPIEGEHRQVAVGFVEFSGVDELMTAEGAGAVALAVDEVISLVQDSCDSHGVTFWETDIAEDGGKIMLVAGAPSASEDDAGALLATARDIVDSNCRLRVRIGVNFGRVFTGGFGPPYRRTYSAKGDAINLAARLMSRAAAGEVYASEAAIQRSRLSLTTEELEPFLVKGKQHPVRAHRVFGARSGRRAGTQRAPVLVGREKEMLLLLDRLQLAESGGRSCVELVGPTGIGKSRLVEEIRSRATAFRVIDVACGEFDSLAPYAALSALLGDLLGVGTARDAARRGRQLKLAIDRLAPKALPLVPLVAPVMAAEVDPTPETDSLDPRFRQELLAETLSEIISAALAGPALIIVEDAQWMDDASASLLRHVLTTATARWLVLVARRPADRGLRLTGGTDSEQIDIGALDPAATVQLLRSATAERPLVPHLRDAIAERSGGNPLFLMELLGAGRQPGFDGAMPDSVEGVFAAQIDRLPPEDRRILRIASVLGNQVDLSVLHELLGSGLDISALSGDFLTSDGHRMVSFRHRLMRDAAYEGLSYARRRELHARAAAILEDRAGGNTAEIAGVLATHFACAGEHALAWRHARIAADRARSINAPAEAAAFYEQALRAGRSVRDIPDEDLLGVAEALGDARSLLGQFSVAEESFRCARQWSATPTDAARLQYKRALATERAGNYRKTLRLLSLADRSLGADDHPLVLRMRAEVRAQYGLVRHRQGRGRDAVRLLRDAVELATQAGANDVLANTLLYLDIAELTAGISGDGSHARRALAIQKSLADNPWLEARALNQLGIRAYFAGRWSDAVRYYSESRDACHRAGDRWTAAVESANIAEVLADQGHLAEAEPVLEEALETYRAAGTATFIADGTRLLGRLAGRRGDPELSRQLLAAARGIYESDGESLQVVLTDAILAESLVRAGEAEAAADLARRVLTNASTLPGRHLVVPLAQRVLGVALRSLGLDASQARQALAESIESARRHDSHFELALSLQALGDLWPTALTGGESEERDSLFDELGIIDSARTLLPLDL